MNPREAEKLLGGHAAGILTPEEQRRLFQAALEHQDIFNLLMDEEPLRLALADPRIRQALIHALTESNPVSRPWWRHPAALASAAGVLLTVGTTLVLTRETPRNPLRPESVRSESIEKPAPQKKEVAPAPQAPSMAPPSQAAPQALDRSLERKRKMTQPMELPQAALNVQAEMLSKGPPEPAPARPADNLYAVSASPPAAGGAATALPSVAAQEREAKQEKAVARAAPSVDWRLAEIRAWFESGGGKPWRAQVPKDGRLTVDLDGQGRVVKATFSQDFKEREACLRALAQHRFAPGPAVQGLVLTF